MLSWMILLSVTARHRIEKLENENEKLRRENEKLRHEKELVEKEKEKLRQERDRLKDELDLARRAAKRQAAPFSKGEPKTDPRRPGRKPGVRYGRKGHRPIPPIVDEEIKVPLPERSPCCGGCHGEPARGGPVSNRDRAPDTGDLFSYPGRQLREMWQKNPRS